VEFIFGGVEIFFNSKEPVTEWFSIGATFFNLFGFLPKDLTS